MKTFEERYTAWVDDQMSETDRVAFERELEAHPEAQADRDDALKLGALLRQHGSAPALTSGDFFNTQLMERIEREERTAERAADRRTETRSRSFFSWALPHLAWGGAFCLLLSFTVYREWVAPSQATGGYVANRATAPSRAYDAHVLEAKTMEPGVSATTTNQDGMTVLWLDGLDYLPATYELR